MMKNRTTGTVEKVLSILEVCLNQEGEIGLSELANLSRLNISTVHRITSILVNRGYLKQRQRRGQYSLGLKFLEFSSAIKSTMKIREVALPFLEKLNKVVGESVNLAILDSNKAVYIEHIESGQNLRIFTQVGNRVPLHCTGVGKVLLAHMREEEIDFCLSKRLTSYTDSTITDLSELKKELLITKREGVATDAGELELGVRCVASPLKDWNGNVVAAVSVSGPSARLSDERVKELGPLVKSCGLEISRAMGYTGE